MEHLVLAARQQRRGGVHLVAQVPGGEVADEFPRFLDEGRRASFLPCEENATIGGVSDTALKNE